MKYDTLKALVNAKVYENTEQRITGGDMNNVLQSAIASLGAHYQMGGLVSHTDQITVGDEPVVFLATTPGPYTHFGGIVVADGEVALLVWSGTAWSKQTPDIATRTEVSQLGQKLIKLVGIGSQTGGDSGVTQVGDIYYNGAAKQLRKCTNYRSASDFDYVVIPFYDGAIYTCNDNLYIWNGEDLICKTDYTVIENANTGGYDVTVNGTSINKFGFASQAELAKSAALINFKNQYTADYAATAGTGAVRIGNEKWITGKRGIIVLTAQSNFTLTQMGISNSSGTIAGPNSVWSGTVNIVAGVPFYFEFIVPTNGYSYFCFKGAENVNYSVTYYYNENDNIGNLANLMTRDKGSLVSAINSFVESSVEKELSNEIFAGFIIRNNLHHFSTDSTELMRVPLPVSEYIGKRCVFRITSPSTFTITKLIRCTAGGVEDATAIATNIEIVAGVPCNIDYVFNDYTVNYIKVVGGANQEFSIQILTTPGDRIGALHGEYMPSYYESQMLSVLPEIQANVQRAGRNSESFIFITDPHWISNHRKSPLLIRYILEKSGINLYINGGDILNDTTRQEAIDVWMDYVSKNNFGIESHYCYGNHDGNRNEPIDTSTLLAPIENLLGYNAIYAICHKNNEATEHYLTENEWSYYFDRPHSKTRFVVLDAGNSGNFTHRVEDGGVTTVVNNTETISAFLDVLGTTPANYNIVLITHAMRTGANWGNITIIENIIDAYNAKQTYTYDGETYNFANANGRIVGVFAGHDHQDSFRRTTGGVPIIITDMDGYNTNSEAGANFDTINEQCFDVVTVDFENEMIHCVRIGRGSSRDITLTPN